MHKSILFAVPALTLGALLLSARPAITYFAMLGMSTPERWALYPGAEADLETPDDVPDSTLNGTGAIAVHGVDPPLMPEEAATGS